MTATDNPSPDQPSDQPAGDQATYNAAPTDRQAAVRQVLADHGASATLTDPDTLAAAIVAALDGAPQTDAQPASQPASDQPRTD